MQALVFCLLTGIAFKLVTSVWFGPRPKKLRAADAVHRFDPGPVKLAGILERHTGLTIYRVWREGGRWFAETSAGAGSVQQFLQWGQAR